MAELKSGSGGEPPPSEGELRRVRFFGVCWGRGGVDSKTGGGEIDGTIGAIAGEEVGGRRRNWLNTEEPRIGSGVAPISWLGT